MRDALAKVKADLGPDAVILSTQRLDDGHNGLGGGIVEITATVESQRKTAMGLKYFQRTSPGRAPMPLDYPAPAGTATFEPEVAVSAPEAPSIEDMLKPLMDEVRGLRALVNNAGLTGEAARIRPGQTPELLLEDKAEPGPLTELTQAASQGLDDLELLARLARAQAEEDARDRLQGHDPVEHEEPAPLFQNWRSTLENTAQHAPKRRQTPSLPGLTRTHIEDPHETREQERLQSLMHGPSTEPVETLTLEDEPPKLRLTQDMSPRLPWLPTDNTLAPIRLAGEAFEDERPSEDKALETLRRNLMGHDQASNLVRNPIEQLEGWLQRSDIAPDRQASLIEATRLRLGDASLSREVVERAFIQELVGRVKIRTRRELDQRRITAFVGPTGVGKTTTLAKIAAEAKIDKHRTVGLLTIDTYRIGAVEQLRKYAHLLEIPLEIAVDRMSLKRSLRRLDHCDTILIDTIGRSPRDEEPVRKLGELFEGIPGLGFELCINATTSLRNMDSIQRSYRILAPESVIFTKLDEAFAIGPALSTHLDHETPLSYFTTGQCVPEDIEQASVERLLGMILPLND